MSASNFAVLPEPPYYVVIFSSQLADDEHGYAEMAERMVALAQAQPGFLGLESVRGADGFGITTSYWATEAAILAWRANVEHLAAQRAGRERWYAHYQTRVARVERAYGGGD